MNRRKEAKNLNPNNESDEHKFEAWIRKETLKHESENMDRKNECGKWVKKCIQNNLEHENLKHESEKWILKMESEI